MRLDIRVFYRSQSLSEGLYYHSAVLTLRNMSFEMFLAGKALPAVGAENHGGTTSQPVRQ